MCLGVFDTQTRNEIMQRQAQGTAAPPLNSDFMRRLILGGLGNFGNRTREAGLGTSVTPKPLGSVYQSSVVKDITRQS